MNELQFPEPQAPVPQPAKTLAAMLVLLLVFAVGIAVGQSGVLGPRAAVRPTSAPATAAPLPDGPAIPDAPANFGIFWQALQTIRDEFVGRDQLTDDQLTYGAIRGMVEALGDTGHSIFLTPEAVRAERESLGGEVVGIGVLLGTRDDQVVVVSVISGGPADRAGIRSGDSIVAVDGQSVDGLAPEEVAPRVRGEEGTVVKVSVVRPATGEQLEFEIQRERLRFPAASWTMVPGTNIGLLRLVQFSTGAAAELRNARDESVAAGATSLILDMRSNPGGYVAEAVDVASLFLNATTIYVRELANGNRLPVSTRAEITSTDLPLVVLIDEGTASSAEIVAGSLVGNDRAQLVGQTTFGTGTVLLTYDLADGSAVRLAVERWLTPAGELIFGRGIEPTDEVALPSDQVPLEPFDVAQLAPEAVNDLPDDQLKAAIDLLRPTP
ncbi:MAG: S41 family peptidase [Candidatus Limnocylindrales bacterium]